MGKKRNKPSKDDKLLQKAQEDTVRWVSQYKHVDRRTAEEFVKESIKIQIINQAIRTLK